MKKNKTVNSPINTLIRAEEILSTVSTTFIWAEPDSTDDQRRLAFVWLPAAIAEFGGCRGRRDKYLIDCYIAPKLNSSVARFLLIRRLPRNVQVAGEPSFRARIIERVEQGMSGLLSDASRVWSALSNPSTALKLLEENIPEEYVEPRQQRNILRFPFTDPSVRVRERILHVNLGILRDILRGLCLDKPIPPTTWQPVHVLVGLNIKDSQAYLFVGKSRIASKALSIFIFKTNLRDELLGSTSILR